MPSSRFPSVGLPVPPHLIALANDLPGQLFVNLRPNQQPPGTGTAQETLERVSGAIWVHRPLREFLRGSVKAGDRLLLLFQWIWSRTETERLGTCCVQINQVFWTNAIDDCPRLDFAKPPGFVEVYGTNNFWGPYILAVMRAPSNASIFCEPEAFNLDASDLDAASPYSRFVELARRYAAT